MQNTKRIKSELKKSPSLFSRNLPKEGIICFIIEYFENPVEFDDMFLTDLINIYNELCMGAWAA